MASSDLCPVGVTTYIRFDHLRQCVEALQKNSLARRSHVFFYSDGPRPGDEEKVARVRDYLHNVDGFGDVTIVERDRNLFLENNRSGRQELLDKFGQIIWLAEDIVTAPGFLTFMNEAMNFYRDDDRIISVTGYTPPIRVPRGHKGDAIALGRFNAWGLGLWRDKHSRIQQNLNIEECERNLDRPVFVRKLCSNGNDILRMLQMDLRGEMDAVDVKIMYQQALNGWLTISPRRSLVQNIGHDGSGVHCGPTTMFDIDGLWDKTEAFEFVPNIDVDDRIRMANRRIWEDGTLIKVKRKLIRMTSRFAKATPSV